MTENIGFRAVLLGFIGLGVMLVLGVVTVAILSMDDSSPAGPSLSGFEGYQVVDQACVQEIETLELELARVTKELDTKRQQIAQAKALQIEQLGQPVAVPESIPAHQRPKGFKGIAEQAAEAQEHVILLATECSEYPCIAVYEGKREGFYRRMSQSFRDGGFSWSTRWVAEGVTSHDEGARHFVAVRFYAKDELEPPQMRYLERGLDTALVKAMNVPSVEISDR